MEGPRHVSGLGISSGEWQVFVLYRAAGMGAWCCRRPTRQMHVCLWVLAADANVFNVLHAFWIACSKALAMSAVMVTVGLR